MLSIYGNIYIWWIWFPADNYCIHLLYINFHSKLLSDFVNVPYGIIGLHIYIHGFFATYIYVLNLVIMRTCTRAPTIWDVVWTHVHPETMHLWMLHLCNVVRPLLYSRPYVCSHFYKPFFVTVCTRKKLWKCVNKFHMYKKLFLSVSRTIRIELQSAISPSICKNLSL